ncbi:2Fe-2S iron-sulfur cluster-binding protein [Streptomyces sp. WMMC500]|uniref:2Fe-2S iron-sulfur cluster-binding protein n=1 Tax=Streptomyces sp. WMMC500 TaxID=3015154 RepID=UPI00248C95F8|nr:2Fe-2S iron-sulfur cluster-binding protein [Streptomyces sp. WMMC500]WBB59064.1 2Fe-2S iron-sulfur cluster-binding protein [Streptomyces sp. WMMC500]
MSREQTGGEQQPQYGTGGWQPMPQGPEGDPDATAFVQLPPEVFQEADAGAPLAAPGHGYVPPPIAVPATDPGQTGAFQIPEGLSGQTAGQVPEAPEEYGQGAPYGYGEGAPDPGQGGGYGQAEGQGRRPGPGAGGFGQAGRRAVAESRRAAMADGAAGYAQGAGGAPQGAGGDPQGAYGLQQDPGRTAPRWSADPAYPADHDPDPGTWSGAAHPGAGDGPYGDVPGHAEHPADREGPPAEGQISAWRPVRQDGGTAPSWAIPTAPDDLPEDSGEYALHDRSAGEAQPDGEAREHAAPEARDVPPGPPDADQTEQTDQTDELPEAAAVGTAPSPALPPDEHPLASYVLRVNGADRPVTGAWIGESLLYVLRERLGLAGAKDGCSQGECGACSVKVDGRLVAACLVPAATAAGAEIRTVEGLADQGVHSDVQRALAASGAVQCGFCVPGLAMTVHDLLEGNHSPSDLEARRALSGNLCRCTGYRAVLDAVQEVIAGRRAPEDEDAADDAERARIPQQAGPGEGGAHPVQDTVRMPPPRPPNPHEGGPR